MWLVWCIWGTIICVIRLERFLIIIDVYINVSRAVKVRGYQWYCKNLHVMVLRVMTLYMLCWSKHRIIWKRKIIFIKYHNPSYIHPSWTCRNLWPSWLMLYLMKVHFVTCIRVYDCYMVLSKGSKYSQRF